MTNFTMQFTEYIAAPSRLATAAVCLLAASMAWGLEVQCTPGSLSAAVADAAAVTELKLTGSVDASDLFFIDSSMPSLRSLDLSGVTVAAYSGDKLRGLSNYPAATIPANAFTGNAITSLTLPAAEVTIEAAAFAGTAITGLTLPANVTLAGDGAFSSCPQLLQATVGTPNTGNFTFAGCSKLEKVTFRGTTVLGTGAFEDCTALTDVEGTSSVATVGAKTFDGCSSLTEFAFGAALESIGARAFASTGLIDADLTSAPRLRSLGEWAFAHCPALTAVQMPAALASVGKGAFFDCASLVSANFPPATLNDYVFKGAALTNVSPDILANLDKIGDYALMGASGISELHLGNSLDSIGTGAMVNMTGLRSIDAQSLDHVPALGEDVWGGVEQSAVKLSAAPEMVSEFAATPQWQDFHIEAMSTAAPIITTGETGLQGRFDGATLLLRSQGADITTVSLYDTSGTLLTSQAIGTSEAAVDTSAFTTNIYIVVAELNGELRAVLKLLR